MSIYQQMIERAATELGITLTPDLIRIAERALEADDIVERSYETWTRYIEQCGGAGTAHADGLRLAQHIMEQ